jgi:predicted phosphodiesterase
MCFLRKYKRFPRVFLLALFSLLILSSCRTDILPTVTEQIDLLPTQTASEIVPSQGLPTATLTEEALPSATPVSITQLSQIAYRLPLTVQHVADTSAILFFELEQPADGVLLINSVEHPEDEQIIPLDASQTRHQIVVDSLLPGQSYQAQVGLGADNQLAQPAYSERAWGPVYFTTQSGDQPLRVGVIGDSGFGEEVTFQIASAMAAQDLDFVIHTGDAVYQIHNNVSAVEAFQQKWYLPFEPVLKQMPIYPVVGNHDIEESARVDGVPFYYAAFPSFALPGNESSAFEGHNQWYAIDYQGWQFLMLDTQTFFGEAGRTEQDAWLAERLSDPKFKHTIPVFHVPPYSSGNVHQYDGIPVRDWIPLFEAANVPLVLSGHSHNYERLQIGSVEFLVSGGGSSSLYGQGDPVPESQYFAAQSHFVILALYADRIEIQSIAASGEVIDQFTFPVE